MLATKDPHRRLLQLSVASVCKDSGFQGVTKETLETLTELLQAHLTELTRSCRKFAEHGHRTTPDLTDVKMALAEVGSSAHAVHVYSNRVRSQPPKNISSVKPPVEHKTLKTSLSKVNQPSYIPSHFPEYPEVHTFVRTPAVREPINQYETVRERVAVQRENTEESLVNFLARTNPTETCIFDNIDTECFPQASVSDSPCPYLKGLSENENDEDKDHEHNDGETLEGSQSQNTSQDSNNSNSENQYLREPKRLKIKK
ncbi:transcription initiation factor TFIID subunit 8-like [Hydractinia symbiolongicarpus]|uniref:transcription initiation factor TFIID subunit 8-like n=1 Tax=Hydractinia symbiolongicarpus TaxID=13093 RepID=UPI00254B478A|nr:transcription initiation factor TFIID subunit 8-like [Hydractinia symbiolongicarpus]